MPGDFCFAEVNSAFCTSGLRMMRSSLFFGTKSPVLRGGGPVFARKGEPFLLRRGFAAPVSARLRRGWPKLRRSPHQGEFTLEECGLSCGGLFASAAYGFSLPAREGNLVNEVFASGGAAGFPRYEDMGRDEAADGGG